MLIENLYVIRADEEEGPDEPLKKPEIEIVPDDDKNEATEITESIYVGDDITVGAIIKMRKPRGFTAPDLPPYNPNPSNPETEQNNLAA